MQSEKLVFLLLKEVDGQPIDLSGFTKQQIDDCVRALVAQGLATGKPIKRLGDPEPHYDRRGLTLTSKGQRYLETSDNDV